MMARRLHCGAGSRRIPRQSVRVLSLLFIGLLLTSGLTVPLPFGPARAGGVAEPAQSAVKGTPRVRKQKALPEHSLARVKPAFGFKARKGRPALIFGSAPPDPASGRTENRSMSAVCCGEAYPVVLTRSRQSWDMMQFILPLPGWWAGVYASPDRESVWAVAAAGREGPSWELELFYSGNGGRSWEHRATIVKPLYWAEFRSLELRSDGSGILSLNLPKELARLEIPPGFYLYHTTDRGRNWSEPSRSAHPAMLPDNVLTGPDFGGNPRSTIASGDMRTAIDKVLEK